MGHSIVTPQRHWDDTLAVRLHALMRLLVSDGHMTPMAVRQISKIIPKPPVSGVEKDD